MLLSANEDDAASLTLERLQMTYRSRELALSVTADKLEVSGGMGADKRGSGQQDVASPPLPCG